jgi:hypothetical protein
MKGVNEMDYVRIMRDLREDADKTQTQIAEVSRHFTDNVRTL